MSPPLGHNQGAHLANISDPDWPMIVLMPRGGGVSPRSPTQLPLSVPRCMALSLLRCLLLALIPPRSFYSSFKS